MKNRKWFIVGLISLFIILVILIKTNIILEFDNTFYNLITFKMNNFLTNMYKCFTFLGSTIFIVLLAIFFFVLFLILKKKNMAYITSGVIILSTILNNLIKIIMRRERPDVLKLVIEKSFSFPSGHTMAAVSLYGILLYLVLKSNLPKKLKISLSILLGILPICIAISRVYLGAHYMSDVLGAYIVSTIILLVVTYYIDKYKWL